MNKSCNLSIFLVLLFLAIGFLAVQVSSSPLSSKNVKSDSPSQLVTRVSQSRWKRSGISDQRLAELETLLALKRMRDERLKNRIVAFGLFDPERIGKRKRRESVEELQDSSLERFPDSW